MIDDARRNSANSLSKYFLLSLLLSLSLSLCVCVHRYIEKNIKLYELANDGTKLSVHAQANFARSEVAAALRKGPYQVNVLLGGFDEKAGEPCLYTMDYTGSLHKVNFGVQGYASYFCLSLLDRVYESSNMTEEEAVAIIEQCIEGLNTRFLAAQPNFIIKAIDKDGTRIIKAGKDPTDT